MRRVVQALLLVACAIFLVRFFTRNYHQVVTDLELRPLWIPLLCAASGLQIVLVGLRQQWLIEHASQRKLTFQSWFRVFMASRFLNLTVPQAGNVYRGMELKNAYQISYTAYLGSLFASVWIGLSINFLLSATALALFVRQRITLYGLPAAPMMLAGAIASLGLPMLLSKATRALPLSLRQRSGVVFESTLAALRDLRFLSAFFAISLASFVVALAAVGIGCAALGLSLEIGLLVLFQVVLQLTTIVIITPANLGVAEITTGVVGQLLGTGLGAGIVLAALLRLTSVLSLVLLALPMGTQLLRRRLARPS